MKLVNIEDLKSSGDSLVGSTPTAPKILFKEIWIDRCWIVQQSFLTAVSILFIAREIATELGYEDTDYYTSTTTDQSIIVLRVPHSKKIIINLHEHRKLELIDGVYQ